MPNIYAIKIPPEGLKLNDVWTLISIERLPKKEEEDVSSSEIETRFNFKIRNNASGMESFETKLDYSPSTGNAYTHAGGYGISWRIPSGLTNHIQILLHTLDVRIHVAVAYHIGCSGHNSDERTNHIFKKKE
jgi:hypothetical protein